MEYQINTEFFITTIVIFAIFLCFVGWFIINMVRDAAGMSPCCFISVVLFLFSVLGLFICFLLDTDVGKNCMAHKKVRFVEVVVGEGEDAKFYDSDEDDLDISQDSLGNLVLKNGKEKICLNEMSYRIVLERYAWKDGVWQVIADETKTQTVTKERS